MKKIILSAIILFLAISSTFAQYQTYNWIIGPDTFLDFNGQEDIDNTIPFESPSSIPIVNNYSILSDSSDQIVIYIQNDTVYFPTTGDKIQPQIGYSYSPNQPFIIQGKEDIDGKIQFEIFALGSNSPNGYDLFYSSGNIDNGTLNLDNTNKLIASNLSSKMAVYRTQNKTLVITHDIASDKFKIFSNLPSTANTETSIGTSLTGTIGSSGDDGFFKISPSGKYFVTTSPSLQYLEIYNFDTINSVISNKRVLNGSSYNAVEFSAGNDNLLYASVDNNIFQITTTTTTISQSSTAIGVAQQPISNMQLALDGKIYVSKSGDQYTGVINNPELENTACFYDDEQIPLNSTSTEALPAFPASYFKNIPTISWNPNSVSYNTPVNFTINSPVALDSIYIDFNDRNFIPFHSYNFTHNIKSLGETTIKYIMYFKNANNELNSVQNFKKINITLPLNMHLIEPSDTIICDTLDDIDVFVNYPNPNSKFIWTSIYGNISPSITTSNPDTTLKYPDIYCLEIQDTLGNHLAYDTLIIKQYEPIAINPVDSVFLVGSSVDLELLSIQQPQDFLTNSDLNFTWNYGDGNINHITGSNLASHVYSETNDYTINLNIEGLGTCIYNLSKTVYITNTDSILPNNPFLNIHDDYLCDTSSQHIFIEIPHTNYVFDIHWFYYNNEILQNENNYSLEINKPGKYYVELFDEGTFYAKDSVIVHYKQCQDINVSINVNGVSDNYSTCNESSEINFTTDLQINETCPVDKSNLYYYWDFGDNTTFEDYNAEAIDHFYELPGTYVTQLFITDEKGCEHYARRTISIQEQTNDTIYLTAKGKDLDGNYIFNLNDIDFIRQTFLNKSTFFSYPTSTDFSNSTSTYTINVNSPVDIFLNDASDITFFLKIALWNDFTATLKSPEGISANIVNINVPNYNIMFGYPGSDLLNYNLGKTKTYSFNENGIPIDLSAPGLRMNSYLTPDEQIDYYDFLFLDRGVYKFDDTQELAGQKINGTWTLDITTNGYYGKIDKWGLKFNPLIFKTDVVPDYIYCYDDAGNVFESSNLLLKIPNLGGENNIINCEMHYPNTNCTIKKILSITYPKTPNVLTPNGDGINDLWMPVSSNSEANIVVLDKIGRVVANFKAGEKPLGWDGTYNGNALPSDSYWYIIKLSDGKILKGVLTIVR